MTIPQSAQDSLPNHDPAATARSSREDIAYTVNHTILCGANDIITPFLCDWVQGKMRDDSRSYLKEWFTGEVIGDVGAVPIAVGLQRYAPGFMERIGSGLEPLLGGFFRKGAAKAARIWADEQHISRTAPEVKDMENALYRYEIDHLPQAAVWTVSSIGMNIGAQKLLPVFSHGKLGNPAKISELLLTKSLGSVITAGVLVGGRSMAPHTAHQWDRWVDKHLFAPAERVVREVFGLEVASPSRQARLHRENDKNEPPARQP